MILSTVSGAPEGKKRQDELSLLVGLRVMQRMHPYEVERE